MKYNILLRVTILMILTSSFLLAQDSFIRSAVIDVPAIENGGFGDVISGVDLDGDGLTEIYAVNDNWSDSGDELIPRIYMYEKVDGAWTQQWMSTLAIPLQNTWPALAAGDLDGDGKGEVIWGPVNNLTAENPNPGRIIVFEANGNDNELGVSDGAGNWLPNSSWNLGLDDMVNMRPFKWYVEDIDGDEVQEVVFADRAGSSSPYKFGVASVTDIPDAGDGSETWTLEFAGASSQPKFVRSAVINTDPVEPGGFGNVIAGVDFDGDGINEIYAVNDNWNDGDFEVIPRIYKFEWNGAYWEIVWSTVLPGVPKQNTWPGLDYADTDGDGKMEIFWGPVNFLTDDSQNPARIVVYEAAGDGSDVLGVDNGDGNYKPNAAWSILDADGGNERPFTWHLKDIDSDGKIELIYGARAGNNKFGIVSVDNVPDNADGSETWTLEASALTEGMTIDAGTVYDVAVIANYAYLIHDSGNITPIAFEGGAYVSKPILEGIAPGGSWKASSVVDLDNDGQEEIVMGQWLGGAQVYLLQPNGDGLDMSIIGNFASVGSTRLNGGASGDLDGDGNLDFVFGSRTGYSDPNAALYRLSYNGGTITDSSSYSVSVIDHSLMAGGQWDVVACGDVDGDGKDEALYSGVPRSAEVGLPLTIVEYSDGVIPGGAKWDIAIANGNVYTFDNDGSINLFKFINGEWQVTNKLTNVAENWGSFKGSTVADVNGDGIEEIALGTWSTTGAGKVYLLQEMSGGLTSDLIADLGPLGAVRLNGAAAGDIDADGNIDFVFGSRGSNGAVFRVEYRGGDITDAANYSAEKIDEAVVANADQLDIVTLANVDDDEDLEVIYSGIPRSGGLFPITILDLQKIQTTDIADVKVDADGNFEPDNAGLTFTIKGVVTSPDLNTTSLSIYIQDATAGINVYSAADPAVLPQVGDLIQVTGSVLQYNGLTELEVADADADIVILGLGTVPAPVTLTVDQWLSNGEIYESMLIKVKGIVKLSGDWPAADANANITVGDGYKDFTMRIDKEFDLAGQAEPTYPIDVVGVANQFDSNTPPNAGYQLLPRYYTDISQGVAAPPTPYFFMQSPEDGATITMTDPNETFTFVWDDAFDANGDDLIYQFKVLPNTYTSGVLNSASFVADVAFIRNLLGSNDQVTFDWSINTKGAENAIVASIDTSTITFIHDIQVAVEDENMIPTEFYVNQNYPNPFNPTTTIKFGLPEAADVTLVIYDIIGREVATLINNQAYNAGVHNIIFNASRLASGTYIYRLNAGKKTEIKKMLLLK
jgi:hypothetical protein